MTRDEALGLWARAPLAWTASPRRRRVAFLLLAAPAPALAVLGTPFLHDVRLLIVGLTLPCAASLARLWSEPRFLAWEAARAADIPSTEPVP